MVSYPAFLDDRSFSIFVGVKSDLVVGLEYKLVPEFLCDLVRCLAVWAIVALYELDVKE